MLTALELLHAIVQGRPVPGRHVVISAHPDDETISLGGTVPCLTDVTIVQLTTGVSGAVVRPDINARRRAERTAALEVLGMTGTVTDLHVSGRDTYQQLLPMLEAVRAAMAGADVVWTHPYEGGHVDHDAAAWLAQRACERTSILRLEFASYHSHAGRKSTFGAFWPDARVAEVVVRLTGARLARKRAAIAAYGSQAHILRKFPRIEIEPLRVAPVYDFRKPSPPPSSRWDSRAYQPTTTMWRAAVAEADRVLNQVAA